MCVIYLTHLFFIFFSLLLIKKCPRMQELKHARTHTLTHFKTANINHGHLFASKNFTRGTLSIYNMTCSPHHYEINISYYKVTIMN